MPQMDTTAAPYGDIVALYPHHCFIPTVSALDVADATCSTTSPPIPTCSRARRSTRCTRRSTNQEHVSITAENAAWFLDEIDHPTVAVSGAPAAGSISFLSAAPNPAAGDARLTFAATGDGACDVRVYALGGRLVRALTAGFGAGTRSVVWDGRDDRGAAVPAGLYFVRVAQGAQSAVGRIVRLTGPR